MQRLDNRTPFSLSREEFSTVFSDDVELTDVRYLEATIYKYYFFSDSEVQRTFFSSPTFKFAHKDDLNDPFELSRRWEKFGCPFSDDIFDKYVRQRFEQRINNRTHMDQYFRDRAKKEGIPLSRQQRRHWLSSKAGKQALEKARQETLIQMKAIQMVLPRIFRDNETEFINSFAQETGILSLTQDGNSPEMWDQYAGGNRGFVLAFDATHDFFSRTGEDSKKRVLLRKVFYRDDRISDFWKNPNYLFLVKESKYRLEKEWRMLKELGECQQYVSPNSDRPIYLVEMPLRLIKSITFGSAFPKHLIPESIALLRNFDNDICVAELT